MRPEIQIMADLDKVPNVPYFPRSIRNEVSGLIEKSELLSIKEDAYAIYVNYKKGDPNFRLIIDSHLDHPAFVVNNHGLVQNLGSIVAKDQILKVNSNQGSIPVSLFSPDGEKTGDGYIEDFRYTLKGTEAYLEAEGNFTKNTQVVPNVDFFVNNDFIQMRSADNLTNVSISIELLNWLSSARPTSDVTVIFTKLEEIAQVSATHIAASKESLVKFNENTFVVVLEAATVGKTIESQKIKQMEGTYDAGILIRISDNELVYQVDGKDNMAEAFALRCVDELGIPFQHGPSIGRCNATAYTLFSGCPNIIGITIPCRNKHNFDNNGVLSPEIVRIQDVNNMLKLLKKFVLESKLSSDTHADQIVMSQKTFIGNNAINIQEKKKLLYSAYLWAQPRMEAEHLYAMSIIDNIRFAKGSINSLVRRHLP